MKTRVIDALVPTRSDEVVRRCALGQYGPNDRQPGYVHLDGIGQGSTTESFTAIELQFENWR